jgi:transposase
MQQKINEKTFEGQPIYVGIDVHKKDWKVTIMTAEVLYKTFSAVPQAEKLSSYLRTNFPGATYHRSYRNSLRSSASWRLRGKIETQIFVN